MQRGLKTLPLRVQQQNKTGLAVAAFLNQHERVKKVYYPGLPNHPSFEQAQKYLSGCGGLISFELKTDREGCARFIDALRLFGIGYSWGGFESLIVPVDPAPIRAVTGWPPPGMDPTDRFGVRLSIGLEDPADLIADLDQAFARMAEAR